MIKANVNKKPENPDGFTVSLQVEGKAMECMAEMVGLVADYMKNCLSTPSERFAFLATIAKITLD